MDWLTPFWTTEEYFKTLYQAHKQKLGLYTKTLEEHQKVIDEVKEIGETLDNLRKEHYEVKNFSSRLHKCRSSKQDEEHGEVKQDVNAIPEFDGAEEVDEYYEQSDDSSS